MTAERPKMRSPRYVRSRVEPGMREAVDYLIGVALSAGLDEVAHKLVAVNAQLAVPAAGSMDPNTPHRSISEE